MGGNLKEEKTGQQLVFERRKILKQTRGDDMIIVLYYFDLRMMMDFFVFVLTAKREVGPCTLLIDYSLRVG